MSDEIEIWRYTKVINLENYEQYQLLEFLRKVDDAIWEYVRSQECLIKEFPGFLDVRIPNIENLKLFANKLDAYHKNCNISTIVGASVGIAGSLAAIGGLVLLTVATGGAAAPLLTAAPAIATAGGVTAAAGGVASFGTFVTEGIIEKVELEKINKLLKKDSDYFDRVFPFVQRTSEVTAAVEVIMNFSVFQRMIESISNNPRVVNAIREERPMQELPQAIKDFINDLPISADQKHQMKRLLLDIMRSVEGIRLFRRIFDFFWRWAPRIKKAYDVYNTVARAFRAADASFDAGNAVVNLVKAAKPATRMATAFGALSAISIAIDVAVLVSTFKDMSEGSRSELAGKVRNAAELLQKELLTLEQIYVAITCEMSLRNDIKLSEQSFF